MQYLSRLFFLCALFRPVLFAVDAIPSDYSTWQATINCPAVSQDGWDTTDRTVNQDFYVICNPYATATITYYFDIAVPNKIDVIDQGAIIASTGYVLGSGTITFGISGAMRSITLRVNSDPSVSGADHWSFGYNCPASIYTETYRQDVTQPTGVENSGPITDCDIPGQISPSRSWVDNVRQSHIHDAVDFRYDDPSGKGCSSCGSAGAASGLARVEIQRFHRYRDLDQIGSFGPGVFMGYDERLYLTATGTSISNVEWFDPSRSAPFDFVPVGADGSLPGGGTFILPNTSITGTKAYTGYGTIIGPDGCSIASGATVAVEATSQINLLTNFTASAGSNATMRIASSTATLAFINPSHGVAKYLEVLDQNGNRTTTAADARTCRIVHWNGWRETFELVRIGSDCPDLAGRLTSRTDRNGNAVTISYQDAVVAGQPQQLANPTRRHVIASVQDAHGKSLTFTYARKRGLWVATDIALPNGQHVVYDYEDKKLIGVNRITYPDVGLSRFETWYDSTTNLQAVKYDDAGALGSHARKTSYVTASMGISGARRIPNRIRAVLNGADEMAYYTWMERVAEDARGANIYQYIYEGGGANMTGTLMRYETNEGIPVRTVRALTWDFTQSTSTYTWEDIMSFGAGPMQRILNRNYPAGQRSEKVERDPDSGTVTATELYNDNGSLYSRTSQTINAFQQPVLVTDALSRQINHEYDANGNLLHQTVGHGSGVAATRHWTYNNRGQPLTATDANGHVTDYIYNAAGLLEQIQEPADVAGGPRPTRRFVYDSAGRISESYDAENRKATYGYDLRNRVTSITYADASTETFTYGTAAEGTAGQIVARKDRNGNVLRSYFDAAGRPIRQTLSPPGAQNAAGETAYTYLPGTEKVKAVVADGNKAEYQYDHRLREKQVDRWGVAATKLSTATIYNAVGLVAWRTDPYGRRTCFVYDRADRITRMVRDLIPGGFPLANNPADAARPTGDNPSYVIEDLVYDPAGQLVARIDARGVKSTFAYDAQGRMTAAIVAQAMADGTWLTEASKTEIRYDAQGNQTAVVLPRSFVRKTPLDGTFTAAPEGEYRAGYTYTGRNLVKSITAAEGTADAGTVNFTYTATGQRKTQSDPRNVSWLTTFNYGTCCDRLETVVDALGNTTRFAYDFNGNLLSATDPNGNATAATYDARNRVKTRTNGAGETTTYTYDDNLTDGTGLDQTYPAAVAGLGLGNNIAAGSAVRMVDAENRFLMMVRDGLGRTARVIDGLDHATTTTYPATLASGLVEVVTTDVLGRTQRVRIDGSGLARSVVDAAGQTSNMAYDPAGNPKQARDPNLVGWDALYDAQGRRTRITDTAGSATNLAYDQNGNVTTVTDPLNHSTTVTYDFRDRRDTVTDRRGGVTSYAYFANGQVWTITDAQGKVTTYAYDERGLLTDEYLPTGQATPNINTNHRSFAYDVGGRLYTRTDQTGAQVGFRYDGADRLKRRIYPGGIEDTFGYDKSSLLTSAVSGAYGSAVNRFYDPAGRMLREEQVIDGYTHWVEHGYDNANRLTTITYPDGQVATRSYTTRDQLKSITFGTSGGATAVLNRDIVTEFTDFDLGGRVKGTTLGNGLKESRTWRADNLVQSVSIPGVVSLTYGYDANKRKTAETDGVLATLSQSFSEYTNENQLKTWSRANGDTQTWDLSLVGDWNSTTANGLLETRTHSNVHEVTSLIAAGATTPLAYDGKGNLIQDQEGRGLAWDHENRLTAATVYDPVNGATGQAIYRYDALGRRVQKIVMGVATTFVHDGAQVIREYEASQPDGASPPSSLSGDDGSGAGSPLSGGILDNPLVRVNFQTLTGPIPTGFVADKGKVLGTRSNGRSYGWAVARDDHAVIRGVHPYPQFDTYNRAGDGNPATNIGTWKIALPNGSYPVALVMGDAVSMNQTNNVTVNGVGITDPSPAITGTPSSSNQAGNFDGYLTQATVSDGFLTITVPSTAKDPKLCFIEIGPKDGTIDQATRDRLADLVDDAKRMTAPGQFAPPAPSTRTYVYGSYVDEPVALEVGSATNKQRYYYHANHQYSPVALTDSSRVVTERQRFDAYGRRLILAGDGTIRGTSTMRNPVGFTGRTHDEETGLAYFRARYFSASLGRFIGRDSLGYVDGANLYSGYFVPNHTDPSGNITPLLAIPAAIILPPILWPPAPEPEPFNVNVGYNPFLNGVSSVSLSSPSGQYMRGLSPAEERAMTHGWNEYQPVSMNNLWTMTNRDRGSLGYRMQDDSQKAWATATAIAAEATLPYALGEWLTSRALANSARIGEGAAAEARSVQIANAINAKGACCSASVLETQDVALGLTRGRNNTPTLQPWADQIGAKTNRDWISDGLAQEGPFVRRFYQALYKATSNGGRIKFNLDDLDLSRALNTKRFSDPFENGVTNWELQQVLGNKQFYNSTDFFIGGQKLSAQDVADFGLCFRGGR